MKIYCDFDGTAANNDVGNLLFRTFADNRVYDIVNSWKEGKISSKECLIEECRIARVTRTELENFVNSQELDPFFKNFVEFSQSKNLEVEIVSDGLDFYIERILKNHALDSIVKVHSNRLIFIDQNQIKPEFPYYEQGCGHCANCKGYHVRKARENHNPIVYVGDGLSDRCGANEADIVFAKTGRDLLDYCRQSQISHFEFQNFQDVLNKIRTILKEKP